MSLPVVAPGETVIEVMIPASKVGLIIGKFGIITVESCLAERQKKSARLNFVSEVLIESEKLWGSFIFYFLLLL